MNSPPPPDITLMLNQLRNGRKEVLDELIPVVYSELKKIAAGYLHKEYQMRTLQTTEVVHEVYIKLAGNAKQPWQNRAHFFGIAANAIRQLLVDYARRKKAEKRGGKQIKATLKESLLIVEEEIDSILALDEALARLSTVDERMRKIIELRYFSGLTIEETAEVLQISTATVKREWQFAKAWLYREMMEQ